MKPENESVANQKVICPKVWEVINGENHLVTEKVSGYIRELESDLMSTRKLLGDKLRELQICNEKLKSNSVTKD